MDIQCLPSRPLSLDDIHDLQESVLCTPLFFVPGEQSENDIILFATTEDGVHTHVAFDPKTKEWVEIGFVEVGDSLDDSETMAFSLFSDDAEWLDERYDREKIAIFDEQSAHQ